MSLYPDHEAMAVLVHQLAKSINANNEIVVVAGQKASNQDKWDGPIGYEQLTFDHRVRLNGRGERYLNWLSLPVRRKRLARHCRQQGITHILACFPDEDHATLAWLVAKDLQIPYYLWFHNTYLENRTGLFKLVARYLQPKLLGGARGVFAISQGLSEYYQSTYPNLKVKTLPHGFELAPPPETRPLRDGITRFAMTGSINHSCLDAALRLARVITSVPDYQLHVFGKKNMDVLRQHGIDQSKAVVHGFLSNREFADRLGKCDVMLLPHGLEGKRSDVEYSTIFPTRTIPLLTTGRPILAHSPPEVFFTRFLAEHGCAIIISQASEEAILKAIKTLVSQPGMAQELVKNAQQTAKLFAADSVAKNLIIELDPGKNKELQRRGH